MDVEGGYRLESADRSEGDEEVQEWAVRLGVFDAIKASPGASKTNIRKDVRKAGRVRVRNEEIDAAIEWLSAERYIENRGTPSNQKWHAVSGAIEISGEMLVRTKKLRDSCPPRGDVRPQRSHRVRRSS